MAKNLTQYFSEDDLWQGVKSGSKTCFNRLFKLHYPGLFFYGQKMFANTDVVKDCIQDVFVRVWESRDRLGDIRNPHAYLLVSLRREIMSRIAKMKQNRHSHLDAIESDYLIFDLNNFEKSESVPIEVREFLLKTINRLPKKQKELIFLFFFHELSYAEISEVMGISNQAVRNLMYRTLIHLRKAIGERNMNNMGSLFFEFFFTFSEKK